MCHQRRARTHSGRRRSSFGASVTTTDDDYIKF
jgi:hypothetical protein